MRWFVSVTSMMILATWIPTASAITIPSSQATITYDLSNVAGNVWRYDFSVDNISLVSGINEFSLYFAQGSFDNLLVTAQPANWGNVVLPPDSLLPADGLFDFFALANGVDVGATLGGFQVQVSYFGEGAPGASAFDIIDPSNFSVPLASGMTTPRQVATPVPEPSSLALFGLAILVAGFSLPRRSQI